MYAGTVSPSDPILAALTLSLRLSAAPLSERHLSLITGQPEENIRQILLDLEGFGFAARTEAAWTCGTVPPSLLGAMAATVRAKIPESRMPHYLGFLLPDAPLEECELVVRYLDEELNQQAPETLLCLEFVIRYLRDWGENPRRRGLPKKLAVRGDGPHRAEPVPVPQQPDADGGQADAHRLRPDATVRK